MRMKLLHEEITHKILEVCFEVSNELGSGFLESVYQNALQIALQDNGLKVIPQYPLRVVFRNQEVGNFYADFLVEEKVLLEIKAVVALAPEHQAQVINYLKATGIEVGILVNFGRPKLEYKRLERNLRVKAQPVRE